MNAQVISKIVQKCLKNRCYFYHYGFFRFYIVEYNDKFKKSFEFEAYLHFLRVLKPGVGTCLKIVGSRLRSVKTNCEGLAFKASLTVRFDVRFFDIQCILRFVNPRFVNKTRFVNTFSGNEKLTNRRMHCISIRHFTANKF